MYWTAETDRAVIEFNFAKDQFSREQIWSSSLHSPCSKLVENVINGFGNHDYVFEDRESLAAEGLTFLFGILKRYDPAKGSCFTLGTISVKRYFQQRNMRGYADTQRKVPLEEEAEEGGVTLTVPATDIDFAEFLVGAGFWWKSHLSTVFKSEKLRSIALQILKILKDSTITTKRELCRALKQSSGQDTNTVYRVTREFGRYQRDLFRSYTESGRFEAGGLEYTGSLLTAATKECIPDPKSGLNRTTPERPLSTPEMVNRIRTMYASGDFTQQQIALELGISQTRVSYIVTGKSHRNVVTPGYTLKKSSRRGEENRNAKLTAEIVSTIRAEYADGNTSLNRLGKKYRVSRGTITALIQAKTWRHLGHSSQEIRKNRKLNDDQIRNIYRLHWFCGVSISILSREHRVSWSSIRNICQRRTWRLVTEDLERERQLCILKLERS